MAVRLSTMGLLLCLHCLASANMNQNVSYFVSNPAPGSEQKSFQFSGEYFEIFSAPIRTRYSEVFWEFMPALPLPSVIVSRFNGKIMAITGHEVDLVRINNKTGEETSVPCYQSYNHHYDMHFVSSAATYKLDRPDGRVSSHGHHIKFSALHANTPANIPLVQEFSENNGNEFRQSYHGLPINKTNIIYSPATFVFLAMQINTLNPDGSGTRGGPLPASYPGPPDALYSGLLECPCTTRMQIIIGSFTTKTQGFCDQPITSADACFTAAASTLGWTSITANATVSNANFPPGCVIVQLKQTENDAPKVTKVTVPIAYNVFFNLLNSSQTPCGAEGQDNQRISGAQTSLITLSLDLDAHTNLVTITITGAAENWFGVAFNANSMADNPYAIIVDGYGNVTERRLADQDPGRLLNSTVTVVSQTIVNDLRTVVLTRSLTGATKDYYTFSITTTTLAFLNAIGSTPTLQYHKAREASSISLFQVGAQTCVCQDKTGTINGVPYNGACRGLPLSSMLEQDNPVCDISTYAGGQACCADGTFLLDKDQDIPTFVDEVYFKWRFYFTEYDPEVHKNTFQLQWTVNGCGSGPITPCNIEFTVPQAPPNTPPEETVYTLVSNFQGRDMFDDCDPISNPFCANIDLAANGFQFVLTGGHCHSPACLSNELWHADTNTLLCRMSPKFGSNNDTMNEAGYLWAPPCLWGTPEEGLVPPLNFTLDSNFTLIHRSNNTYAHLGQMGLWQMRGLYL